MRDIPTIAALLLPGLLVVIGAVQIAGPRFLRHVYRNWNYPQHLRLLTGFLDIAAAAMLTQPSLLGWGIMLCAILCFGAVVTMLNHSQYRCAMLAALMMAALAPASVAFPRPSQIQFVTLAPQQLAEAR